MSQSTEALHALLDAAEQALPIVEREVTSRKTYAEACSPNRQEEADKRKVEAERVVFRLCITIHNARGLDQW